MNIFTAVALKCGQQTNVKITVSYRWRKIFCKQEISSIFGMIERERYTDPSILNYHPAKEKVIAHSDPLYLSPVCM